MANLIRIEMEINDPGPEFSDHDVAEWLAYVLHASGAMKESIPLDEIHLKVARFTASRFGKVIV